MPAVKRNDNCDNTSLADKTIAFWHFSRRMNGREGSILTVSECLSLLDTFSPHLNPARPLAKRVDIIRQDVIVGGRRKKRPPADIVAIAKVQ